MMTSRHSIRFGLVLSIAILGFSLSGRANEAVAKAQFALCTSCHGAQAEGNKLVNAPAIAGLPKWYLVRQINNFKTGMRGTHPKDVEGHQMRPMSLTLSTQAQVEGISDYISKLAPTKSAGTIEGDVEAGKMGYMMCAACHGVNAEGNPLMNAPPLTLSQDWYYLKQLQKVKHGLRGSDPKDLMMPMVGIVKMLDDKKMTDVVAYLQTLKK